MTSIPHASIARLSIESLGYPNAGRATLCAMATEEAGTGAGGWPELLAAVRDDRRAFRDDLLQEHMLATRVGGAAVAAGLAAFAAAVALLLKALLTALVGLVVKALPRGPMGV